MAEASAALIRSTLDLVVPAALALSPDGARVAYSTRLKWNHRKGRHTAASIWVAETGTAGSARRLTDGLFNDRLPCWAPDGRAVAFVSDRGAQGRACAVYVVGVDGAAGPRPLTPEEHEGHISGLGYGPDGTTLAFVAPAEKSAARRAREAAGDDAAVWGRDGDPARLWLLDVASGAVWAAPGDENEHVAGFAWSGTGRELAVATRRTPHAESAQLHGTAVSVLEPATGRVRRLCHLAGEVWSIAWRGTDVCFIANNVLGHDTSGTAVYVAGEGGGCHRAAHGDDDCAQHLVAAGADVVVHVEHGLEDRLVLLDGRTLLRREKKVVAFDVAGGPHHIVVYAEGDVNHPTEVFCAAGGGEAVRLSDHGRVFAGMQFGHCLFLDCASLDGEVRLDGLFLTPAQHANPRGTPTHPLPTLVLVHGGPYSRNTDAFDVFDPFYIVIPSLLREGFGVLVPNYRGGSGRGAAFASYARAGLGACDEPDVVAMVQHAVELGYADGARLVAAGWSQGGHVAYLAAVRNGAHGLGWRFRGVVAGAGITDWDSMALMSDAGYIQAQHAGGAPWAVDRDDTRARRGSALWGLRDALRDGRVPPMLMLHGERDSRVPVAQAHGFRRALDQAGVPFELVTYPREGHWFRERGHVEDLASRILRFVRCQTH